MLKKAAVFFEGVDRKVWYCFGWFAVVALATRLQRVCAAFHRFSQSLCRAAFCVALP